MMMNTLLVKVMMMMLLAMAASIQLHGAKVVGDAFSFPNHACQDEHRELELVKISNSPMTTLGYRDDVHLLVKPVCSTLMAMTATTTQSTTCVSVAMSPKDVTESPASSPTSRLK